MIVLRRWFDGLDAIVDNSPVLFETIPLLIVFKHHIVKAGRDVVRSHVADLVLLIWCAL